MDSAAAPERDIPLLAVEELSIGLARNRSSTALPIVRELSFDVGAGEIVGMVGESGSGKSTTARALLGLLKPPDWTVRGSIRFAGDDLTRLPEDRLRTLRGAGIALLLQESMSTLHPTRTIGSQLVETLRAHRRVEREEAEERAVELLVRVALPDAARRMDAYPHQLSGGQKQRVALALALSPGPRLLVADEPTSALDATVQAQVLDLLAELRRELGLAVLLISHDLAVVAERCDRSLVLYAGDLMESNVLPDLVRAPRHPYTRALWATLPIPGRGGSGEALPGIPGQIPTPAALPHGCLFHPRCPERIDGCAEVRPDWTATAPEAGFRCVHAGAATESTT
ncbi:MAG: ABC transporter ATP-binding protein [Thermoanaerobaculia bacterium]